MGACGSNNKKPITMTTQPNTIPSVQPSQQKETKVAAPSSKPVQTDSKPIQPVPKAAEIEKPKKMIRVRFIKDSEVNLNNPVFEKQYEETTSFSQVVEELRGKGNILENDSDYNYRLLVPNIKSDDKNIAAVNRYDVTAEKNTNTSLKDILANRVTDSIITIEISYAGLDLPQDVRKAYTVLNNLYACPKYEDNEPIGISVYDRLLGVLHEYTIPDEAFQKANIIMKFDSTHAYCCGGNKLYMSGSIEENKILIDQFIEIDLQKLSQHNESKDCVRKLPNLLFTRELHSMIFVPNKYIFIAGGTNISTVELYDIEKNVITHDSSFNIDRLETALCIVNNSFLYAFCGMSQNLDFPIEKCNLRKSKREWEIVRFKNDSIKIESQFFSVSYGKYSLDSNEIILLEDQKKKSYVFKQIGRDEHLLEEVALEEVHQPFECRDRFFYPVDSNISILMPHYFYTNMRILRFNAEYAKLDEIKFDAEDQEEVFIIEKTENREKIDNSQADPINKIEKQPETDQKANKEN